MPSSAQMADLGRMIGMITPFFLLCLQSSKVNLRKTERSIQFPMPFFALGYCIVVFIYLNRINEGLTAAVNGISSLVGGFSPQLGAIVDDFTKQINMVYWIFYVSNTAIITSFLVLKKTLITILSRLLRNQKSVHLFITGYFYEYDGANDVAVIKPEFGQMRTLFKVFYYATVVISVALFLLCKLFMNKGWMAAPFYPVFGILIVVLLIKPSGLLGRRMSEKV